MSLAASWRVLSRPAGWALPILAVLLLAPAVRAGCGDYVSTRLTHAETTPSPAPPRKPCHGPGCSQAPASPPAPAPPVQPRPSQEWGCAPAHLAAMPHDLAALLPADDSAPPARLPRLIYRPPRLAF